jgi:hypothetical protein
MKFQSANNAIAEQSKADPTIATDKKHRLIPSTNIDLHKNARKLTRIPSPMMMILGLPICLNSPLAQTNPLARSQALSLCCEKAKGSDRLIGNDAV